MLRFWRFWGEWLHWAFRGFGGAKAILSIVSFLVAIGLPILANLPKTLDVAAIEKLSLAAKLAIFGSAFFYLGWGAGVALVRSAGPRLRIEDEIDFDPRPQGWLYRLRVRNCGPATTKPHAQVHLVTDSSGKFFDPNFRGWFPITLSPSHTQSEILPDGTQTFLLGEINVLQNPTATELTFNTQNGFRVQIVFGPHPLIRELWFEVWANCEGGKTIRKWFMVNHNLDDAHHLTFLPALPPEVRSKRKPNGLTRLRFCREAVMKSLGEFWLFYRRRK